MRIPQDWSDHDELLHAITCAIQEAIDTEETHEIMDVDGRLEPDGYGQNGSLHIRTPDGKTYSLHLEEDR